MKKIGNVFILGDSYSTFEGYVDASRGCGIWYPKGGKEETDVKSVEETWWHICLDKTESNLILNSSSSGTTICNTTYGGAHCPKYSFIGRLDRLLDEGFFKDKQIDTFIIFGGTNDNWSNAPIGSLQYENWTEEDKKQALPAICYLFDRIKTNFPTARVIKILNTELKEEINEGYKKAALKYGVEFLALENIDKLSGHPSVKGMKSIAEQLLAVL
ncbi:MAG: hypothetical protein J6K88_00995 [Oscillospiraceae bacterium]|nr:hypothetical protein [Oscillospiraceae bacterium]